MMNKKNTYLILILISVLTVCYFYILPLFTPTEINLEKEKPELIVNADRLISAYALDEDKADELFAGKIIEVIGTVKEVNFLNERMTLLLKSNTNNSVICDIHPTQKEKINKLKENDTVKIKGICKGFLKDVVLLNCFINLKLDE